MTGAFVPYAPLQALKAVADDLWIVDGPEIRMGYLGAHIPFPTRMTVVRLAGGGLFVHSPVEPTDALFDAVAGLGPVRHLVGPNSLHYWWLPEWHARFPAATVSVVPGLAGRAKRPLPPHEVLSGTAPAGWAGDLDQVLVPGSLLTEAVFHHRASRSVILTDLIENFEPARVRSWFLRRTMQLFGAADPDGRAPFDMQLTFWRHRKAVRAAVETMLAWAPERVIIAHGRWYETGGTAELRRAFRWVL